MNWWKCANKKWDPVKDGFYVGGDNKKRRVSKLISYAERFPTNYISIKKLIHKNGSTETKEGLFEEQLKNPSDKFKNRAYAADLKHPIIIDEEHWLVDGSHRLAKAYWMGHKKIKAKIINPLNVDPESDE